MQYFDHAEVKKRVIPKREMAPAVNTRCPHAMRRRVTSLAKDPEIGAASGNLDDFLTAQLVRFFEIRPWEKGLKLLQTETPKKNPDLTDDARWVNWNVYLTDTVLNGRPVTGKEFVKYVRDVALDMKGKNIPEEFHMSTASLMYSFLRWLTVFEFPADQVTQHSDAS